MERLEDLADEYSKRRGELSQRELAEYEYRMWTLYCLSNKGQERKRRREWLSDKFGGGRHEFDLRQALLSAGATAAPLWERIKNGMPLATANRLVRESEKRAFAEKIQVDEALQLVLKEYDSFSASTLASGKVVRRRNPYSSIKQCESNSNISELKQSIRSIIVEFVNKTLENKELDAYEVKQIKEELALWVEDGLETFQRRLSKLRAEAKDNALYSKIGKTRFGQAIDILGLKAGEFVFGKSIPLKKAKRAHFERIRPLHPDRNGGIVSEEMKTEYQAVNEAYLLLEEYANQIGSQP